ncbi:hypothetical protein M9H77_33945 [Catharanthus roseus]|uniref:Uncharacterized protein n=1 Tax=Catharanthus roseus TaxID=4058 RepID=A0ACB9ZKJ5_CATRO|nr:hypothetical protein M9H77_33945 [Catharanthus roseus]
MIRKNMSTNAHTISTPEFKRTCNATVGLHEQSLNPITRSLETKILASHSQYQLNIYERSISITPLFPYHWSNQATDSWGTYQIYPETNLSFKPLLILQKAVVPPQSMMWCPCRPIGPNPPWCYAIFKRIYSPESKTVHVIGRGPNPTLDPGGSGLGLGYPEGMDLFTVLLSIPKKSEQSSDYEDDNDDSNSVSLRLNNYSRVEQVFIKDYEASKIQQKDEVLGLLTEVQAIKSDIQEFKGSMEDMKAMIEPLTSSMYGKKAMGSNPMVDQPHYMVPQQTKPLSTSMFSEVIPPIPLKTAS